MYIIIISLLLLKIYYYHYQGCESSDFNLISDYFDIHKTQFSDFSCRLNALKITSFQAFQIISDFFLQMLSHPCILFVIIDVVIIIMIIIIIIVLVIIIIAIISNACIFVSVVLMMRI